jgi:hypothetical protein
MEKIDFLDLSYYRQEISFDNINYLIDIRWNVRANAWFLSMYDVNEVPIFEGVKIVTGLNLLYRFYHIANCPSGLLYVFGNESAIQKIDYDSLAKNKFSMIYLTQEEFNAI